MFWRIYYVLCLSPCSVFHLAERQISPWDNKASGESSRRPQLLLYVMDQTTKTFHSHLPSLHEERTWYSVVWFGVEYHFNIRTLIRQHTKGSHTQITTSSFLSCSNKQPDFYSVQYYCRWQRCHLDMTTSPPSSWQTLTHIQKLIPYFPVFVFIESLNVLVRVVYVETSWLTDLQVWLQCAFHNASSFSGEALQRLVLFHHRKDVLPKAMNPRAKSEYPENVSACVR